jgi:hypothetical protein
VSTGKAESAEVSHNRNAMKRSGQIRPGCRCGTSSVRPYSPIRLVVDSDDGDHLEKFTDGFYAASSQEYR